MNSPAASSLRLHLHGVPAWQTASTALRPLERKHAALLAWLWLEGPTTRSRLAGLLWPEVPEDRARANLRQRLLKLRQSVGDIVHDDNGLLALAPSATVAAADPPGAALLGALEFDDCEALARWLEGQRESKRERRKREWLAEVREAAQGQRLDDALYAADQLLHTDRESEEAYRVLMEVYHLRGDHAAALSAWDRCRDMLRQLYGAQPSAATQQLGQRLLQASRLVGADEAADAEDAGQPARTRTPTPTQTQTQTAKTTPAAEPPAAAPSAGPAGAAGLPNFWTRSVGTEFAASRLRVLVCGQRLVTVHGPGGSGKTRLAVEVAQALTDNAPLALQEVQSLPSFDRIAFVALVDCVSRAQALDVLCAALGVEGKADARAALLTVLTRGRTLLVLDNLEQLEDTAGLEIAALLSAAPGLHVLATSRRLLDIDGEHAFELEGLPLPRANAPLQEAAATPSVMLFVDRARASRADFQLTEDNVGAVLDLVQLLAGMPLAIELAASRMRAMTAPELLARLRSDAGSPLLDELARQAQRNTAGSRHASMRHVVDWSWRQLSPPLIETMQALSTFAHPARIETVAAVAGLDLGTAWARVAQLRDQSLALMRRDSVGTPRFVLLQPVREFVVERTEAAIAAQARARLRHWLIEFGHACTERGYSAAADVEAELPQVFAAVVGAVAESAHEQAAQMAVALRRHWEIDTRAPLPMSVVQALGEAQASLQHTPLRCEVCLLLSYAHAVAGAMGKALALADEALRLAPTPRLRSHALMRRAAALLWASGDLSGVDAPLQEALDLAREVSDVEAEGLILRQQLLLAVNRDDNHIRGEQLAELGQALWERVGHRRNAYSALMDRATCWIAQQRFAEAHTALVACEDVARAERHATGYIMASWQLGRVSLRLRRADAALAAFRRCVYESWHHNRLPYVSDALVLTPGGLAAAGAIDDAARLMGFAVAHWQKQFGVFYKDLERDVRWTRRLLHSALGPVRLEALRLQGVGLTLPEAVALALGSGRHSRAAAPPR